MNFTVPCACFLEGSSYGFGEVLCSSSCHLAEHRTCYTIYYWHVDFGRIVGSLLPFAEQFGETLMLSFHRIVYRFIWYRLQSGVICVCGSPVREEIWGLGVIGNVWMANATYRLFSLILPSCLRVASCRFGRVLE